MRSKQFSLRCQDTSHQGQMGILQNSLKWLGRLLGMMLPLLSILFFSQGILA